MNLLNDNNKKKISDFIFKYSIGKWELIKKYIDENMIGIVVYHDREVVCVFTDTYYNFKDILRDKLQEYLENK